MLVPDNILSGILVANTVLLLLSIFGYMVKDWEEVIAYIFISILAILCVLVGILYPYCCVT